MNRTVKSSKKSKVQTTSQGLPWWRKLTRFFMVMGPGLIVMQADTEAGSITTAAVAGAQYGFELVGMLLFLALPLYLIQEMTARLGSVTGKGHAYLIRKKYGL